MGRRRYLCVPAGEGWFYLSGVLDPGSRRVVGRAMGFEPGREPADGRIAHGARTMPAKAEVTPSTSRRGNFGYRPNQMARLLRHGKSGIIAIFHFGQVLYQPKLRLIELSQRIVGGATTRESATWRCSTTGGR